MADIPTRQYDLRSGRREELHVPVHIQMSEDSTFLKQLMATQGQGSSNSGQVSDISSLNESDCDVLKTSKSQRQKVLLVIQVLPVRIPLVRMVQTCPSKLLIFKFSVSYKQWVSVWTQWSKKHVKRVLTPVK